MALLLALQTEVIEPAVGEHAGRLFKAVGDGFLVEFASAVQAVKAALAIQQANADGKLPLRIGIHVGDVVIHGDDLMGDGINVAARIEAIADAGGIALSRQAYDQVRDRLDIAFQDKGEVELKNIVRPVHVFTVATTDSAASPTAPALVLPDKPSIAVLPFDNMSADPEQAFFGDGIAEDILTTLAKIRHLLVIARNSSFTYKGRSIDVRTVGQELGVRYVLEGSVRKSGNRVRVTAQLVDCTDGHHVWADRFDGGLDDVFELQDRITQEIVTALEVELTEGELVRVWRKRSGTLMAYEAFHKARDHFMQFTREGNQRAAAEAVRAIEINPQYWDAWLILGYTNNMAARFGWSSEPEKSLQAARDCVARILAVDDTIGEAYSLAGGIALTCRDYDGAIASGRRAVALGPNSGDCHHMMAMTLCFAGQPEEAIGLERHALRLNPLNPTNSLVELGRACVQLGRHEDGRAALLQVVARRPRWMNGRVLLVSACHGMGRAAEAAEQAKDIMRARPSFTIGDWSRRQPYQHPRDLEAIVTPLRKVGLPD